MEQGVFLETGKKSLFWDGPFSPVVCIDMFGYLGQVQITHLSVNEDEFR